MRSLSLTILATAFASTMALNYSTPMTVVLDSNVNLTFTSVLNNDNSESLIANVAFNYTIPSATSFAPYFGL